MKYLEGKISVYPSLKSREVILSDEKSAPKTNGHIAREQ